MKHQNKAGKRVSLIKTQKSTFPELWARVYVVGPEAGPNFNRMFARARCSMVDSLDEADLVVFTGAHSDVTPELYSETNPHPRVQKGPTIQDLDLEMIEVWIEAQKKGIMCTGICRGLQFLHVMHGGTLYQDVAGHNTAHVINPTDEPRKFINASSVHHQCVQPDPSVNMTITAVSEVTTAKKKWTDANSFVMTDNDIEAVFYNDTLSVGVQGHPEYSGYSAYTRWYLDQLYAVLCEHPDVEVVNKTLYRIKPNSDYKLPKKVKKFYDLMKKKRK